MEEKKLRTAIYIRVSTSEISSKWVSTIAQKKEIEKYIKMHSSKYEKTKKQHIYIDNWYSWAREDRPWLIKLMEDAKNNKFDVVFIWKIDRFFRNTLFLLEHIKELDRYWVKFNSVTQDFDTTWAFWKMLLSVLASIAEMERDLIRERTMLWRQTKAEQWYYVWWWSTSYWYDKIEEWIWKKLVINEEEAEVVKRIFDLFVNEKKSINEIAKILTAEKVLTKHNKRNFNDKKAKENMKIWVWYPTTVSKILQNEMYIWKYYYWTKSYSFDYKNNVRIVKDNPKEKWWIYDCPIIIEDKELFYKAKELIEKNKYTKNNKRSHYFAWLIECKQCWRHYVWYKATKWTINYRCWGTKKDKMPWNKLCKNKWISEKILLENIWDRIDKIFRNPKEVLEAYYITEFNEKSKINSLKKESTNLKILIIENENKYLRMQEDYYSLEWIAKKALEKNLKILEDKINILNKRFKDITKRIEEFEQAKNNKKDLIKLIKSYNKIYSKLTDEDKLDIIKEFIEKIEIDNNDINILFKFSIKKNNNWPRKKGNIDNKEQEYLKDSYKKVNAVMGNTIITFKKNRFF